MKTSYNIYQVTFDIWLDFEKPCIETLVGYRTKKYGAVKHVKPECYKHHSGYTYKSNCKLVGRITNIRFKPEYVDKLRRNMNDVSNTIVGSLTVIAI